MNCKDFGFLEKRQVMMAAGGKRLEIERGYTIRSWMKGERGEISGGEYSDDKESGGMFFGIVFLKS